MGTPAQNFAAITAAVQAAATADLVPLNQLATYLASLETGIGTVSVNISSPGRKTQIQTLIPLVQGVRTALQAIIDAATTAQTSVPNI